jgi:hypothetical protein
MPIHVLDLERDCLRVGNNQLLTQGNAVYVGNTLNINNSIRWPAEQGVVAPGSDITTSGGLRLLLYPNNFGIGIESSTVWYASGGNHRWYSLGTSLGTFSNTGLNITIGANAVNLSNGTSNWIGWNQSGVAAPAVTTRSAGTKLVLYPNISGTSVDYAIGIESSTMWFSVDGLGAQFRWYANTTQIMQLNGTSGLTQSVGNTNIRSGVFFVDGGASRVNINSTANNEAGLNVTNPGVLGTIATASLVDSATDLITTGTHGWANGQQILLRSTGTYPGGTASGFLYHLCVRSTTTFTLHNNIGAALAGTGNVDITSAGSGTITAHPVSQISSFYNNNGNVNFLKILNYRNAAGADWTTTSTRLSHVVDATYMGYVEFNPPGFAQGVALGHDRTNFMTMSQAGQFLFGNTTANNVMFAANGNVGVGNTAPTNKLRVQGDITTVNGIHLGGTQTYNENFLVNEYAMMARMFSGADAVFGHNIYSDPSSRVLKQRNAGYYAAWIRMYYNNGIYFGTSTAAGAAGDTVCNPAGTTNEKMVLTNAGKLGIGTTTFNTNGGVLQVADGISFPATQSACSDGNTLDDYEEGTWTPELRDGATVLTQGYSYRSGVYHKIGRMVHIHFGFLLSSLSGTSTNALRVYGLPFTSATTGGYQEPMGYAIFGQQPTAADANEVYFFVSSGQSYLEGRKLNGSDTVYTSNQIDGDTFCKFSAIYWV